MPQNDFLWSFRFEIEYMGRGRLGGQRAPVYSEEVGHRIFLFNLVHIELWHWKFWIFLILPACF